MVKSKIKLK